MIAQGGGVSIDDATRALGCTRRTLYRDLAMLQEVGYPLYSEADGDGVTRWRLVDGFRQQHAMVFSHEELVALWMARGALSGLDGTVFTDGARSLLEKLHAAVPREVRERLDRSRAVLAACAASSRYAGRAAVIETIRRAAEDHRTVRLTYGSLGGRRSRRLVDPYVLWFDPARAALYFAGWAHDRQAVRTFLLDRVATADPTAARFAVAPGWDAQRALAESFAGFQGRAEPVRLRFHGRAARLAAERRWHPSQRLRELPDGGVELAMRVPVSPGLRGWVLSWLPEVEVLEPGKLAAAVERAVAERPAGRRSRRGVVGVTRDVTGRGYGGA